MKKQIIFSAAVSFMAVVSVNHSSAQETISKDLPVVTVTSSNVKMDERVWNNFKSDFKDAYRVTWYKSDKAYIIKFILNEIAQTVVYTQKGQQVYHLSYVEGKDMPVNIKEAVENSFPRYSITLAIKVEQNRRTIWVVNMENAQKLLFVRVEDDEVELVKELENAR